MEAAAERREAAWRAFWAALAAVIDAAPARRKAKQADAERTGDAYLAAAEAWRSAQRARRTATKDPTG